MEIRSKVSFLLRPKMVCAARNRIFAVQLLYLQDEAWFRDETNRRVSLAGFLLAQSSNRSLYVDTVNLPAELGAPTRIRSSICGASRTLEAAQVERLADVFEFDVYQIAEVRNRSRDFDNAVISTRAQHETFERLTHECL